MSLTRHGPGGEARRRDVLRARIIVLHRLQDALVVEAGRFRDQVELVGRGEFDVAIGVVEQLGELGLDRRDVHHFRRDRLNSAAASCSASGVVPLTICGISRNSLMP